MNIIIEQDKIKREIHGAFSLCLSADDRKRIIHLLKQVEDEVSYGWIDIFDVPVIDRIENAPPLPWVSHL